MQRNRNIASGVQHQHHQLGLYNELSGGITHIAAVVPQTCVSNKDLHHDTTDMTGQMTPAGRRMLVRDCVKKVLFRRLKFFRKELHGMYDQSETSVCGLVIKNCNVALQDATLDWWAGMRKIVIATHTDHRNNVIKTMRLRYRGMYGCSCCVVIWCTTYSNMLNICQMESVVGFQISIDTVMVQTLTLMLC